MMKIKELLETGRSVLAASDCESPLLDSLLLLGHILNLSKEELYIKSGETVSHKDEDKFRTLLSRRADGYPVAYLINRKEFYGFSFYIEEGVLCPRPDTEILVEEALSAIKDIRSPDVLDICTGSGCVGLSLLAVRPDITLTASDVSEKAEAVFRINNDKLCGGTARFVRSSWFENLAGCFDLIAANPPYLTSEETSGRGKDTSREPALALDGGGDGLDPARIIIDEGRRFLKSGGRLLLESAPRQTCAIAGIMESAGYGSVHTVKDLAGYDRITSGIYGG